ncbi:hypothetical protein INS49_007664 [Diaporthe citri]|uniref:uncharacterized protein n=1 Tax=Diaporthe citri TaxID=83186 RepID=UPI001C7EDBA6|nr:uncharacterized protein INS49_007664 [Diaporthe citri]KAG6362572.1 hypothetical protein INS49_007664 [Diaporthe citri]
MPETFFVETTPPSSTSERWTSDDGPPVPARQGKDRPGVKLRSACDFCHAAKVKCSGGSACDRCRAQDLPCTYSLAMRAGKPKGSCNRKTLDKHARIRQQHAARHASLDWGWSPPTTMGTGVNEATWFNGGLLGMGLQTEEQNTPGFDHLNYASDPQPQCLLSPESVPEQGCCSIPALTEEPFFEAHLSSLNEVNFEMPNAEAANICHNTASLPFSPSTTPEASVPVPSEPEDRQACTCFTDQTESLNRLYSFHRSVQSQARGNSLSPPGKQCRLDTCIQRINTALTSSKSFLSCTRCSKESCSVLLTVSSLQLVMRLYEYVVAEIQCTGSAVTSRESPPSTVDGLSGDHSHMSCRLGDYEVSPEESVAIRRLVVRRALQKGRETLAALKMLSMGEDCRGDGSSASVSPSPGKSSDTRAAAKATGTKSQSRGLLETDLTAADATYLQQVVCRCDAVLDVFLRAVSVT